MIGYYKTEEMISLHDFLPNEHSFRIISLDEDDFGRFNDKYLPNPNYIA